MSVSQETLQPSNQDDSPLASRLTGRPATSGELTVRVRYSECDPMGVAHHASYLAWFEMARTELLRASGISYAQLEHAGYLLVIAKLDVRYRQPARYDDLLLIRTRVVGGSRVKIDHEYEVFKVAPDGVSPVDAPAMTAGRTTLACVARDGVLRALPDWLVPPPVRHSSP